MVMLTTRQQSCWCLSEDASVMQQGRAACVQSAGAQPRWVGDCLGAMVLLCVAGRVTFYGLLWRCCGVLHDCLEEAFGLRA
jgi:hypothetical protein